MIYHLTKYSQLPIPYPLLCLNQTSVRILSSPQNPDKPAAAKSLQSCPTLCNPTDGSPPGSPLPGILQARTLEWVAISFSSAWKWKVKVTSLSRVQLSATPWTAAHQAPPSMGFSRRENWSGVPSPSLAHKPELTLKCKTCHLYPFPENWLAMVRHTLSNHSGSYSSYFEKCISLLELP